MSSYSNYLGSKKCCSNNLAKTVVGPQGAQGKQGPIGPFGNQGATGTQGTRGATGPCCRGPPGFTGAPGVTGSQGADGAAGGNGGLPLFLNYTIDHTTGSPGVPALTNPYTGPVNNGTAGWIPTIQAQQSSSGGQTVEYTSGINQDFITRINYTGTFDVPSGFYTLYLYAYTTNPGDWTVQYQIFTCQSVTGIIGTSITPLTTAIPVTSITSTPTPLIIPHVGTAVTLNDSGDDQLLLRLTLTQVNPNSLFINSEYKTGSEGYSILQTTFAPPGAQGVTGVTGPQGFQGEIGTTGVTGAIGATGYQGSTGSTGAQGFKGETGATGSRGATGYQGSTGATGAQGFNGATGATGAQGYQGQIGATAPGGALGAYASIGSTATSGITGQTPYYPVYFQNLYIDPVGANFVSLSTTTFPDDTINIALPGIYDIQFSALFDTGNSKNIWIWLQQNGIDVPYSNTKIHSSGGSADQPIAAWNWFIKTTSPNEYFRIAWTSDDGSATTFGGAGAQGTPDIPPVLITVAQVMNTQKGDTGSTGAQGLIGSTGATGQIGATGVTGAQGLQGSIGATGSTGAIGTTGTTGAQGLQGSTGATGAIGRTGATGAIGRTGATGAQGLQGSTGATGVIGATGATGAQGLQGSTGSTGAIGTTGATGAQGYQGYQGEQGAGLLQNYYAQFYGDTGYDTPAGNTGILYINQTKYNNGITLVNPSQGTFNIANPGYYVISYSVSFINGPGQEKWARVWLEDSSGAVLWTTVEQGLNSDTDSKINNISSTLMYQVGPSGENLRLAYEVENDALDIYANSGYKPSPLPGVIITVFRISE